MPPDTEPPEPVTEPTPSDTPLLPQVVGDRTDPGKGLGEAAAPTPPPESGQRKVVLFAVILFLVSLGAVFVGSLYTLIRQIQKKKRSKPDRSQEDRI